MWWQDKFTAMAMVGIVLREIFWELIYAPVWWYTFGAVGAVRRFYERLKEGNQYLGWSVWLTNIFTPMYAQYDLTGRLISIGVRVVQAAVRSVLLIVWLAVSLGILAAYFLVPLIAMVEIIYHWQLILS
ncbi:hypothetical protein A3I40_00155 [Candidatus Uhrbacteria bacterium RIFCSPLOWO2_02_FULL_48_12]|uniref:Uncharacterized protein n=1 Tax=Candidatus Uhrbacteria bacterium RIFCSPLOWO2_02_FULL_48_12 TaxID=1802407 RepID=A0A1F7VA18_9BACT|nr:MAG: hypothetical protein A3I40_00155 [Candidatus Uhrbacteria bacterium RIFCSPLOWO2_02_FULL_48_12]